MSIIEQDPYANLDAKLDKDYPKSWNFTDDGPKIIGEFVELTEGYTARGSCKIVVLRIKDGTERSVFLFHTVLRTQFARVRPKPGELVAVRFLGDKVSAGGTTYKDYKVEVNRSEGAADWDSLDTDPGELDDNSWDAP